MHLNLCALLKDCSLFGVGGVFEAFSVKTWARRLVLERVSCHTAHRQSNELRTKTEFCSSILVFFNFQIYLSCPLRIAWRFWVRCRRGLAQLILECGGRDVTHIARCFTGFMFCLSLVVPFLGRARLWAGTALWSHVRVVVVVVVMGPVTVMDPLGLYAD